MNFNVYIKKPVGDKLTKVAKCLHRSRNSIITEAIEEWFGNHEPSNWPKNFFDFTPIDDVLDFKELRKDLRKNTREDPLA